MVLGRWSTSRIYPCCAPSGGARNAKVTGFTLALGCQEAASAASGFGCTESSLTPVATRSLTTATRDGLNNRKKNLRIATHAQNMQNVGPRRTKKGARLKGVERIYEGLYRARIWADGKRLCLGYFPTEELAGQAYDAKAKKTHGEFAHLNFPSPIPTPGSNP